MVVSDGRHDSVFGFLASGNVVVPGVSNGLGPEPLGHTSKSEFSIFGFLHLLWVEDDVSLELISCLHLFNPGVRDCRQQQQAQTFGDHLGRLTSLF